MRDMRKERSLVATMLIAIIARLYQASTFVTDHVDSPNPTNCGTLFDMELGFEEHNIIRDHHKQVVPDILVCTPT